jgi:arylsulfatase A-like enzyme
MITKFSRRALGPLALALMATMSVAQQSPLDAASAEKPESDLIQAIRAKIEAGRKPNFIFILADDLGYGELGCYGQKRIQTPNIDRLAAEGTRFTQCYAGSTVCAPSRAALMTGLHTGHVSVRGNAPVPLATNEITVAEVLKDAGYQTGCFGKWGLGLLNTPSTPDRRGFNEWLGYLGQTHAHDYYPTQLWRASLSIVHEERDLALSFPQNANGAKGLYSHDLFTKVATNFIRVNRHVPFFLYLPFTIPHAHNELEDLGMQVPSDAPYSKEEWPQAEKNKAAMITRLDRDVGALMAQLKALKLESNTVVFFSSDNGPHNEGGAKAAFFDSAGPLRGIKRDMYEGGIRVPMIVRWPGRITPGTVSDQVWAFWDFLPTAAAIAGARPPTGIDGLSILPTLLGQKQTNQHEFLYWEFHENGSKQAVRMGDWKAVRLGPGEPLELYDLKSDPGERNNVAVAHTDVVRTISEYLKTARKESQRWSLLNAKERAEADKQREPDKVVN